APAPAVRGSIPPVDPTGGSAPRPAGGAVGVPIPPLAAHEPGVTMRAPIAPPPAKPDSVELLRKRTGTPRIGVPLLDPAVVLRARARGARRARSAVPPPGGSSRVAPPGQASVSGVIEPAPGREPDAVLPPSVPDEGPRGKPHKPATDPLHISQVWYDEGDQLS